MPWPALTTTRQQRKQKGAQREAPHKPTPPDGRVAAPSSAPAAAGQAGEQGSPTQVRARLKAATTARDELAATGAAATLMQALDEEIANLKKALQDRKPQAERLEGLRGVILRGERRLEAAKRELKEALDKVEKEEKEIAENKEELAQLEKDIVSGISDGAFSGSATAAPPPWLKASLADIARHVRTATEVNLDTLADTLDGLLLPPPAPMPPDADDGGTRTPVGACHQQEGDSEGDAAMENNSAQEDAENAYQVVRRRIRGKAMTDTPMLGMPGSTLPA